MRWCFAGVMIVALGACAHRPPAPQTIAEMHQAHEWQYETGEALYMALDHDSARIAEASGRAGTLSQLQAEGYECLYGEAHPDYPEPAAVCARSFATRACQMNWEVTLTSDPARPDSVEATEVAFRRDCVGETSDWPEPVISVIDSQLAPAELPGQP